MLAVKSFVPCTSSLHLYCPLCYIQGLSYVLLGVGVGDKEGI